MIKEYSRYISTDKDWIGVTPNTWDVIPLKHLASVNDESLDEKYDEDFEIEYVDISSVEFPKGIIKTEKFYFSEAPSRARRKVKKGDIVISTVRTYLKAIAQIHKEESNLVVSTGFAVVRPTRLDHRFCKYILESDGFISDVIENSKGVSYPAINPSELMMIHVPVPPATEQVVIGLFLDDSTSKIDSIIRNKQKLIELLKEERAAIINQAVTKGIDPNVKMKDSGVEWLGEIPNHWELKKLRYISRSQNGISQAKEYFESGFPFVTYGDVYNNPVLPTTPSGAAQSNSEEQKQYSIEVGDILFTRTSETADEIAISSVALDTIPKAVFSGFLIRVRPESSKLVPKFSQFYFRCELHRDYFASRMNVVTRASLSQEVLGGMPVVLPPLKEQKEIGRYLTKKTETIDQAIHRQTQQINLLEEYRSALISEVVTGKISVI